MDWNRFRRKKEEETFFVPDLIQQGTEKEQMDLAGLPEPVKRVTLTSIILLILLVASSIFVLGITNLPVVQEVIPSETLLVLMRIGVILLISVYILYIWYRERSHTKYQMAVIQVLRELNTRLGTILKVARRLGSRLDQDELLRDVVNEALPVTSASYGAVYMLDRESRAVELKYASGVDMSKIMFKEIPMVKGILADAAAQNKVITTDDMDEADERENMFFGAAEPGSQVVVPLWAGGKLKGMLITGTLEKHRYTSKEIGVLMSVADVAGMALTNAELYSIASRSVAALKKRREFAEAMLEEIMAGVIAADAKGNVTQFNKEAERITGFSFTEKAGKALKLEPSPMLNPLGPIESGMLEVMRSGTPVVRGEAYITNSRNLTVPVTYCCYCLKDDLGGPAGSVAVFMKVRGEPLQIPEEVGGGAKLLLESLVARIEKLYILPLKEVLQGVSEMEPKKWMQAQMETLDILYAGYGTLDHLVRDVELYTSIDEIPEGEKEGSIDLRELTGGVVQELLEVSSYGDVDVRLELGTVLTAYGYPRLARLAVMKVIENSLAAAADDSNRVEISGEKKEDSAVIAVQDFGRGVPKELEDFIFAPFFTTSDVGSGLGLPIAAKAMRNLGGRVWFESSPESGTIFYLEFPVEGRGRAKPGSEK